MEPDSELERLIEGLGAVGSEAGTGGFTLDPRRALELLKEQGSLGRNAPLFLFRALFEHTGGSLISWKRGLFEYQLRFDPSMGTLPNSTYRVLAEGAFNASSLALRFEPGLVRLSNSSLLREPFLTRFNETFEAAQERLRFYPVEGLYEFAPRPESWQQRAFPEGRLEATVAPVGGGQVEWVVCGICYSEGLSFPLRLAVFDDALASDLTLSKIPPSTRKTQWIERAKELLHTAIRSVFEATGPVYLDRDPLGDELETMLGVLPYLVTLPEDDPLRKLVLESVWFKDVFSGFWSLSQLLALQIEDDGLLIVPAVPTDCPKEAAGRRPVLLWRAQTRRFGNALFHQLQSGAGYLYSLRRGEQVQVRKGASSGELLAAAEWKDGRVALKKFGRADARCEVELVGKRRNSETIQLDEPAPLGLRLLWESEDELASWSNDSDFQTEFRKQVVGLIDSVYPSLDLEPAWLRNLLVWADGVTDLRNYAWLFEAPMFENVDGSWVAASSLFRAGQEGVDVPVLQDRSASIPDILPYPVVLWSDPLLSRLGLRTYEIGSVVRTAYWKEQGRRKWLARYHPCRVEDSEYLKDRSCRSLEGPHLLVETGQEGSSVLIWREGRPLACRELPSDIGTGLFLVYVDDAFPADRYWSGPDPEAYQKLLQWCQKQHALNR
jgi:hypothetical protein